MGIMLSLFDMKYALPRMQSVNCYHSYRVGLTFTYKCITPRALAYQWLN